MFLVDLLPQLATVQPDLHVTWYSMASENRPRDWTDTTQYDMEFLEYKLMFNGELRDPLRS